MLSIHNRRHLAVADLAELPGRNRCRISPETGPGSPGVHFEFGPEYIMPTPFDPRLIEVVPRAVAQAAMDSGVARVHIKDWAEYHKLNMQRTSKTYF